MELQSRGTSSVVRKVMWVLFVMVVVVAAVIMVRMWWPDSYKLTKYADGGDVSGVRLCLKLGVDPNKPAQFGSPKFDAQTPLTAAAQSGRVEVIRMLLAKGANPNLRDYGPDHPHDTPLATAAMHGQLEACQVLLDAGADPNIACSPTDPGEWGNWTALDWALQAGQPDVANLLRQHGAVEGHRGGKAPTNPRPFP